jgi:alanine dehydrogenase
VPLHLTDADVAALLGPADALAAVEDALLRLGRGRVEERPRQRLEIGDGGVAAMLAADGELGLAAVKTYAWTPGGSAFVLVLYGLDDGDVRAVIDADVLGRLRTAGASTVAARRLARPGAASLGVIGCGRQAAAHVVALRRALPGLERVVAYCRSRSALERFCAEHRCVPADRHGDAGACDIVVTATTSVDPVLRGDWLVPGAFVCAVGANRPHARELDNAVLERASFVCTDSREQARLEAGDLIEPVERGVLDWLEVYELQEVVGGTVHGRAADEDVVVFKSNGVASWDLAVAARIVELAKASGAGRL